MLAGSYVALTVLGRPPGLTQIPLSEAESEMLGVSISSPNSPATERPYSPQDRFSAQPSWVLNTSSLLLYICPMHLLPCLSLFFSPLWLCFAHLLLCICVHFQVWLVSWEWVPLPLHLFTLFLSLFTGWEQQCLQPEGRLRSKNAFQRAAGPAG